ncbi:MAG TPA: hypothetical protein EYH05_16090 [Anaerolineae bacterium]|nr:hypothetical protein [Anaerolineae bacterium]
MFSKKGATSIFLVGIITLILLVVSTSAQGPDGSGWWTSPNVQNASSSNASVVVSAYWNTDSSSTDSFIGSVTLGPNASFIFHPGLSSNCETSGIATNGCRIGLTPDLPAGFSGSIVVSSDQPAVSFVSLKNNPSGSVGVTGGTARASYEGVNGNAVANTLYFPSFKNDFGGQSTIFYVQAAGSDATVRVTYTTQENPPQTYTQDKTILANRSYAFMPSTAGVPSCNGSTGNNCRGGAKLEVLSGGSVAGTVVEYEVGASVAEFVLASAAITPANTDTKILVPSAKDNWNGQTTGIAVLNTTNTDAVADLTFIVKGVTGCSSVSVGDMETTQLTVPANGSAVVRTTAGNTPFPSNCQVFYSVTIEDQGADQNLAATVNQSENKNGQALKTKYNGFAATPATSTVLFPLVKETFSNGITGVSLVNAGSVPTSVTVTYSGAADHVLRTVNISPGQSITLRNVAGGDPDIANVISGGLPSSGAKYAVTAVADVAGAKIVGIAQEATATGTLLDIQNYGGTNQ